MADFKYSAVRTLNKALDADKYTMDLKFAKDNDTSDYIDRSMTVEEAIEISKDWEYYEKEKSKRELTELNYI